MFPFIVKIKPNGEVLNYLFIREMYSWQKIEKHSGYYIINTNSSMNSILAPICKFNVFYRQVFCNAKSLITRFLFIAAKPNFTGQLAPLGAHIYWKYEPARSKDTPSGAILSVFHVPSPVSLMYVQLIKQTHGWKHFAISFWGCIRHFSIFQLFLRLNWREKYPCLQTTS